MVFPVTRKFLQHSSKNCILFFLVQIWQSDQIIAIYGQIRFYYAPFHETTILLQAYSMDFLALVFYNMTWTFADFIFFLKQLHWTPLIQK